MVIAAGSYPAGRWFESDRRYHKRPLGQAVKTSPFHGGIMGSNPVGVTKKEEHSSNDGCFSFLLSIGGIRTGGNRQLKS